MADALPAADTPSATSAPPPGATISGRRVILWLFVALSVATALALVTFMFTGQGNAVRPRIAAALVGDLGIPPIAWQVMRLIDQVRARREAAAGRAA